MITSVSPLLELAVSGLAEEEALQSVWHRHLSAWLTQLHPQLPAHLSSPSYSLGLFFCDDAEIAQLNREWRGQSGATDVLAFASQDEPFPQPPAAEDRENGCAEVEPLELGDIVISRDTAWRQAASYGHSRSQELLLLASHGLLHLLGWDHPDEPSLEAMLAQQDDLLLQTAHLPLVAADSCLRESPG
ncbi:MAG: rRNA maturation RNase YbeY [Cyanobacteriota bacterium]|nr:rRNA maturation RNase YbeY [Cyanobacteriota bacterium]